ncbi:methyltransferase domain-containing protein [Paraburkholderia sp. Ac-20340]|uniref:class I SAM-dependent methyltransferase n=1 Tax=Paraburkholderia sp. Ac-20340 TaxID=2703888 RepID=UPI0019806F7E|nr:methyltransferase domain-containing protein [Paraburkholderia sp. Ac-20340]MBN3852019.1 methyltransferase domain-containing protein [Paraburkholderia sp. Ac-20340]
MSTVEYENIQNASKEERQRIVDGFYWHHSIDFGDGVASKGGGNIAYINEQARALYDGINMHGRSLLDIGAWNGAFSFEAKRRGCDRVLATDHYCWNNAQFKGRETFDLARSLLQLDIDALDIDVPEINPQSVGQFDIVLFSGVFYHLINPVHLLRQISQCAKNTLIVETWQDMLDSDRPGMIFYPGTVLNGDGSNWWGPNPQAMYEILKELGFTHVFYQDAPRRRDPKGKMFRERGIYHAFRTWESIFEMGGPHASWQHLENPDVRKIVFEPVLPKARRDEVEQLARLKAENERLTRENAALRESTSWKITAPIRAIKRLVSG